MEEILKNGFSTLGLPLTPEAMERFKNYHDLLSRRAAEINLTSISSEADVARLHFLDSCAILPLADFSDSSLIDVGSGAGFPGLAMKIAKPDISLTLLDSRQKRVDFLRETAESLGFPDVSCIAERAEEAAPEMREAFDYAVSRAVAALPVLCELCLPFVAVGGAFLAMKGPDCEEEAESAENAVSVLGGEIDQIVKYFLPGTDIGRSCVIIKKRSETPSGYPRRFARITKRPL